MRYDGAMAAASRARVLLIATLVSVVASPCVLCAGFAGWDWLINRLGDGHDVALGVSLVGVLILPTIAPVGFAIAWWLRRRADAAAGPDDDAGKDAALAGGMVAAAGVGTAALSGALLAITGLVATVLTVAFVLAALFYSGG